MGLVWGLYLPDSGLPTQSWRVVFLLRAHLGLLGEAFCVGGRGQLFSPFCGFFLKLIFIGV